METIKPGEERPFWIDKKVTCPDCFAVFRLDESDKPIEGQSRIGFNCGTKNCQGILYLNPVVFEGSIRTLDLAPRIVNCLIRGGYKTIYSLITAKEGQLLKVFDFGRKSLVQLKKALALKGLSLGTSQDTAKEILSMQ